MNANLEWEGKRFETAREASKACLKAWFVSFPQDITPGLMTIDLLTDPEGPEWIQVEIDGHIVRRPYLQTVDQIAAMFREITEESK
jgi:hypothetical protein